MIDEREIMAKKQLKKCGWCGEEIKDNEAYFQIWENDKLVLQCCKKCWFERKDLDEHIRKMYGGK